MSIYFCLSTDQYEYFNWFSKNVSCNGNPLFLLTPNVSRLRDADHQQTLIMSRSLAIDCFNDDERSTLQIHSDIYTRVSTGPYAKGLLYLCQEFGLALHTLYHGDGYIEDYDWNWSRGWHHKKCPSIRNISLRYLIVRYYLKTLHGSLLTLGKIVFTNRVSLVAVSQFLYAPKLEYFSLDLSTLTGCNKFIEIEPYYKTVKRLREGYLCNSKQEIIKYLIFVEQSTHLSGHKNLVLLENEILMLIRCLSEIYNLPLHIIRKERPRLDGLKDDKYKMTVMYDTLPNANLWDSIKLIPESIIIAPSDSNFVLEFSNYTDRIIPYSLWDNTGPIHKQSQNMNQLINANNIRNKTIHHKLIEAFDRILSNKFNSRR